jgi:hypothetical protein
MTVEPITEGEFVEEPRALAVVEQPRGLAVAEGPEGMIALASRMATALRDIVEQQKLYAIIQGKKYPQVEAWTTIARMDNVVAREAEHPIRHDDGSYEAFVELVRLSDGMVIGRASALCGTPDDKPWNSRSEPARRSMAVTRATSRACRQHYSWIMALAGYEPTPADEMPREEPSTRGTRRASADATGVEGASALTGPAPVAKAAPRPAVVRGLARTQGNQDYELRETPDGWLLRFRVGARITEARGPMALALKENEAKVLGAEVIARGMERDESFTDRKVDPPVERSFKVLALESIEAPTFAYPPASAPPTPASAVEGSAVTPPAAEPQPSQEGRCESLSPYNDDPSSVPARCTRETGHKGTHRAQSAETWA